MWLLLDTYFGIRFKKLVWYLAETIHHYSLSQKIHELQKIKPVMFYFAKKLSIVPGRIKFSKHFSGRSCIIFLDVTGV